MGSCIYVPTIKNNGQEVESKLFRDLMNLTHNREIAKHVWALSQVKEFTETLENLDYDENGEVTLESLDKAINIEETFSLKTTLLSEKRNIGALNNKNEFIKYDKAEDIIDKVNDFNRSNPKLVASINRSGDKYTIDVQHKSLDNMHVAEDLMFSNSLNNQLRGIMRTLGFDVERKDGLTYSGIFDPLSGKETADGLRTVIQIAHGEKGELAFPEEFSHFIIEGLLGELLVLRILKTLNSIEAILRVLGEDFDTYQALYKGDMYMLQKEAAGKLLQANIVNRSTPGVSLSLLRRLWNFVKNKFKRINQSTIDKAIDDANKNIENLASSILDGEILPLYDSSYLQDTKPLYKVADKINKLQKIAEHNLQLYSKRLKIILARSKNDKYSDRDLKTIKELQKLNELKQYAKSTLTFLTESVSEIEDLQNEINRLITEDTRGDKSINKIADISGTLRRIKEFADAYADIISDLTTINSLRKRGEVEISEKDAIAIEDIAVKMNMILNDVNNTYEDLRFNTVFNFLKIYWGEDKLITLGKNKGDIMTLEMLLRTANKDIGGADRWISSLSDASDPLLSLIDKVVKVSQSKRDRILEEALFDLRAAHTDLVKAGYDTTFMFERDENNKLTGRLISDIDFIKFNREREEYIQKLKNEGHRDYVIRSKVEAWERKRTEEVVVDEIEGRTEVLPAKSMYYKDVLSKLSKELRAYYDEMIKSKANLESRIPRRYANLYNAIHVRNDLVEGLSRNIGDPKKSAKLIVGNIKDMFVVRLDDTDYGQAIIDPEDFDTWVTTNKIDISTEEAIKEAEKEYKKYLKDTRKQVMTDFSGKLVEKLPVYYTTPLEDMDRLSTDFTASMLAYASMAINYEEMNKIIDVLELTRDLVMERDVQVKQGNRYLVESFKVVHKEFSNIHTIKGKETNIGHRLNDYYASVLYGQRKKDQGTINVLGQELSLAQSADALKAYTSQIGMGLNLFSALSNVTIGKFLLFIEGIGGEYYNLKDLAIGKKNYYKDLPQYMAELNSVTKNSLMGLLIDKFDALEVFNNNLKHKNFQKSAIARIFGQANTMFLQEAGEHYLHTRNMLAMLNATKVLDNSGKEISLYDAFTTLKRRNNKGHNVGSILLLKEGTKTEGGKRLFDTKMYEELEALRKADKEGKLMYSDKIKMQELQEIKEFTDNYTNALKLRINKVAQSLNGAFNDIDKGAIHRGALGRLAAQFKQWMPAHYYRRFARPYYDAQLDQYREGYYLTIGKFSWELLKELRQGKFHLATNWARLSNHEKANVKRALAEMTMFGILSGLIALIGDEKDREGVWMDRMIIYQLKRLKLEVSASMPIHPNILDSFMTIVLSPAASINSFNNLGNLISFWNIFNEIESGRYKGWSEYSRDAIRAIPYINHVIKARDITTEDYMFNIYN